MVHDSKYEKRFYLSADSSTSEDKIELIGSIGSR